MMRFIYKTPVKTYSGRQSITALGIFVFIDSHIFFAGILQPQPPQQATSTTTFSFTLLPIRYINWIKLCNYWQRSIHKKISLLIKFMNQNWRGIMGGMEVVLQYFDNFQYQTVIMLRKKHSEIIIQRPVGMYSPLRRFNQMGGMSRTPERTNLSPIKHQQMQVAAGKRTPRKIFVGNNQQTDRSPARREDNFQTQLQSLAKEYSHNCQSRSRFGNNRIGPRLGCTAEGISIVSNVSNNHPEMMRESKKLFTKYISEMKSDKKRDDFSNKSSLLEDSKHLSEPYSIKHHKEPYSVGHPDTGRSFKQFSKIQMIESVQPTCPVDRSPEGKQIPARKKSDRQSTKGVVPVLPESVSPFQIIQEAKRKRDETIQLINQSFSNPNPPMVNQLQGNNLQSKAKQQVVSIYVQQSSQFADFNLLLQLADITNTRKVYSEQQMVKISLEGPKDGLSMDPFI